MRRALATLAIALDFIAPRAADRLATWLWTHAISQALAHQRGARAHAHPTPEQQTPPIPATTPDARGSTPDPGTTTRAERDADSSQQKP